MVKELMELYEKNEVFRSYVDRYCKKNNKDVKEAILDVIVQAYANQLLEGNTNAV